MRTWKRALVLGCLVAVAAAACGQKSLQAREDALYDKLVGLAREHKGDCDAAGKAAAELVKSESATIEEIAAAYNKMTDAEKATKKEQSQARARGYDKGVTLLAVVCSVRNKDFKDAFNRISPATATP
jgi:hypothetical protein